MFWKNMNKSNFTECGNHHIELWQCPGFLFALMGVINIASILSVYTVINKYDSPELVIGSVSAVSVLIFIVGGAIIKSVEKITEVSKMKSEFVSIVSHQLKAPLSGIRWSTDILLDDKSKMLNDSQEEHLKDVQENTTRMIKLVSDLLDVSRIESGKMNMNIQEVDLRKIAEDVVKELNSFARANNVELKLDVNGNINKVKTDPIRIKLVIQNFIDNAIKYIGNKKGLIKICLRNEGENVFCSVTDNGVGISKKEQKKIFDKFFRGNGIVKKQTIGTGLGLYIAKAAIESSEGKIGFSSEEGKGSTFWFTLLSV